MVYKLLKYGYNNLELTRFCTAMAGNDLTSTFLQGWGCFYHTDTRFQSKGGLLPILPANTAHWHQPHSLSQTLLHRWARQGTAGHRKEKQGEQEELSDPPPFPSKQHCSSPGKWQYFGKRVFPEERPPPVPSIPAAKELYYSNKGKMQDLLSRPLCFLPPQHLIHP